MRKLLPSLLLLTSTTCAAQFAPSTIALRTAESQPTAYGLAIIRAELWQRNENPGAGDPGPPGPAADDGLAIASIANYRAQIKALEIEQGPYATDLPEALTGLAQNYREIGDHDGAARSFKRAIHLTRINGGPYTREQMPLLDSLRESLLDADNMQELDGLQEYIYRVHRKVLEPGSPQLQAATRDYVAWQRSAYLQELGDGEERLLALDRLFDDTLADLRQREQEAPPDSLLEILNASLKLAYLLGFNLADRHLVEFSSRFGRPPLASYPMMYTRAADESPLDRLRSINYRKGLGLTRELTESISGEDPQARARALVAEGDWYRWHDKRYSARHSYREAYELLGGDEATKALREELFAAPTELPANLAYRPDIEFAERRPRGRARVRFTVTESGRLQDLEILEITPEEDRGARIALNRLLRDTVFRPRLEGGEAVDTEGVEREYVFFDDR